MPGWGQIWVNQLMPCTQFVDVYEVDKGQCMIIFMRDVGSFSLYPQYTTIWTRDAKKMQDQSTHCNHVTGLHMRSKPTLYNCIVATWEPASVLLSNLVLTLQEVKEMQGTCKCSKSRMRLKSSKILDKSVIFLHAWSILWVWLRRGQRYPNFLLIRMVWNFLLAKGFQIIKVGL